MDQFIHFGVFHLSTSMEYWENLITTIEQLKSRLWENVGKVNNLVCHGHANMVMKLLIFCIHKWLELCYRMTHLICFMLNTVPCSQQKKTSLRKVYSSASVSIPPHNLKWSWQTCIVENGITNVDCFAMTCNRVTCQNVTYSIDGTRAERSAHIYAKWCGNTNSFEEPVSKKPVSDPLAQPRPGIIKQFLVVSVVSKCSTFKHVIAQVSWLNPHPDRHFYGKPVEVWCLQVTARLLCYNVLIARKLNIHCHAVFSRFLV